MNRSVGTESLAFTRFVGMPAVQNALRAVLVNPALKAVLIAGPPGTGKSAIARSVRTIAPDRPIHYVSPGMTEDSFLGHIDIEQTIRRGAPVYRPGLLARAPNGIVVMDNLTLIAPAVRHALLHAAESGFVLVEREGCSRRLPVALTVVATTTTGDDDLPGTLRRRFDIMVNTATLEYIADRGDVVERTSCPDDRRPDDDAAEAASLRAAASLLPAVTIDPRHTRNLCEALRDRPIEGHRCDIATAHTARALAALRGSTEVTDADLTQALRLTLPHQLRQTPPAEDFPQPQDDRPGNPLGQSNSDTNPVAPNGGTDDTMGAEGACANDTDAATQSPAGPDDSGRIGPEIALPRFLPRLPDRKQRAGGHGRRARTRTTARTGRYVRCRIPPPTTRDIAIGATLRAAAPYQPVRREGPDNPLVVLPGDIREKVRECRTGATILVVVDTSTSMGLNRRIERARGACLSLLRQAYSKRDTIGMISFRDRRVDVVLPPTRSVERAHRLLCTVTTGGKTPIAQALNAVVTYVMGLRARDPDIIPVVAFFSDFRPTLALRDGDDPTDDMFREARRAAREAIRFLIVDSECGFVRLGYAGRVCDTLDGTYVHIDTADDDVLRNGIRGAAAGRGAR